MSLLRGFPVISALRDVSIHAVNIHVAHCNGVMKWVSVTGEVLGEAARGGLHVRVPVVGESQRF